MFKRCTDAPDLEEISASLSPCCPHIHSLLFLFYLLCLVLILCAFSPNIMRLHSSVPLLFLGTPTSSKGNVARKVFTSISCAFNAASRTFARITTLSLCVTSRHHQLQTKTGRRYKMCPHFHHMCDDL